MDCMKEGSSFLAAYRCFRDAVLNSSEPQKRIRKGGRSFVIPEREDLYALIEHLRKLRFVSLQQADGVPRSKETSIQVSVEYIGRRERGSGRVQYSAEVKLRAIMIYRRNEKPGHGPHC